jgi:hypothetical protein
MDGGVGRLYPTVSRTTVEQRRGYRRRCGRGLMGTVSMMTSTRAAPRRARPHARTPVRAFPKPQDGAHTNQPVSAFSVDRPELAQLAVQHGVAAIGRARAIAESRSTIRSMGAVFTSRARCATPDTTASPSSGTPRRTSARARCAQSPPALGSPDRGWHRVDDFQVTRKTLWL